MTIEGGTADTMSRCYKCEENVRFPETMAGHFRRNHPKYLFLHCKKEGHEQKHYFCEKCDQMVSSFGHLVRHYEEHHKAWLMAPPVVTRCPSPTSPRPVQVRPGVIRDTFAGREIEESNQIERMDNLLQRVTKNMEIVHGMVKERDEALRQLEKAQQSPEDRDCLLQQIEDLRREKDRMSTALTQCWEKRQELLDRCTDYAARIVEFQNQLAQDKARRY